MNPAWIAVIASSVAAVGAATAAVITTWSTRRLALRQNADQDGQWLREKRRDSYAAFLAAGARARDELVSIFERSTAEHPDIDLLAQQIVAVRTLTDEVRGAGAKLVVEGPDRIVRPTRLVEEELVIFRRCLETLIRAHRAGDSHVDFGTSLNPLPIAKANQTVETLQYDVRAHLDQFAAVARQILETAEIVSSPLANAQPSDTDLQWLLDALSERGIDTSTIVVTQPIRQIGEINSLHIAVLLGRAKDRYSIEDGWTYSEFADATVEQAVAYLAAHRT
ncbi:hypothetical protein ACFXHA_43110 [Nocardia sp. NPDC059240]|uniref:hypothetical protein n=1 Tax=Nocardia sp. NPDC059240 TaxID=3346786 RepID=UPI0036C32630